eukprot:Phypoly_transcript_01586.p1 GENE.Phypoly_transcript_01586~~Phypoly_transcript_01586.p1  ORF type:complete len:1047 (+),score=141.29 Phypoly_transcript_01586:139-3279(+)
MGVPLPIIIIGNVVICGFLLLRVLYALFQKLYQESRINSVKRKLVHVILACFGLFRFAWSVVELIQRSPRVLHFFLDTTAMCLFFTAFIIVFFHLLKKLSGWDMSRSTFFLVLALILNMGVYVAILGLTIDLAITHQPSDAPMFKAGSIVIAAYSILNALGFLIIGIRVWRNMSLLNKITRPSLSVDQRRKGGLMIGVTIIACILFFAARLLVFAIKPDYISSNDDTNKFTAYLFGYWLAEVPATMVMLYVMKRSYKSTPLLDDTPYKSGHQTASFVTSTVDGFTLLGDSAGDSRTNQLHRSAFSATDLSSPTRDDSQRFDSGLELRRSLADPRFDSQRFDTELPKLRVEFSVSCQFHIARRPVIALMPHASWKELDRASIERAVDRTEARLKANTYCSFRRTLLFVGDLNTPFFFAVFDNPVDSGDSQTLQYVGEASFTINEAQKARHDTITRDILLLDRRGDVVENNGSITIQIIMEESCVRKKAATITKSYLFSPEEDDLFQLHVREELTESKYTFQCAYQLLKILIPLRHQELVELTRKQAQLGNQYSHRNSLPTFDTGDIFGNMMIGIMEGHEETSTFQWFTNLLQHFTKHFESLQAAAELYKSYSTKPYKGLTYKPSTYKADPSLGFIATNLHSQELQIFPAEKSKRQTANPQPDFRYEFVTFGAPAAHIMKFKHGIRGLQSRWHKALQYLKSKSCEPQQAATLVREVEALNLEIRQRHDVVMCQSVAALVTSFMKQLEMACQMECGARFLDQIGQVGFLFQAESLLSTNGPETGMLEDMDVAIKDLSIFSFVLEDASNFGFNRVRFERVQTDVHPEPREYMPPFEGIPLRITIKLAVPTTNFDKLPENVRQGAPIKVYPLLFTQGINEQQTIANTVGDSSLQEDINKENVILLSAYCKKYEAYLQKIGAKSEIEPMLSELAQIDKIIAMSRREKNVEILSRTADLTRRMLGGRATCCKSAKDRTSMSITWEEARILERHHNLPKSEVADAIQVMRSAGVRRENAFKNIGVDKYAFNQIQIMLFPEIYKPPKGTEGARVT